MCVGDIDERFVLALKRLGWDREDISALLCRHTGLVDAALHRAARLGLEPLDVSSEEFARKLGFHYATTTLGIAKLIMNYVMSDPGEAVVAALQAEMDKGDKLAKEMIDGLF